MQMLEIFPALKQILFTREFPNNEEKEVDFYVRRNE